MKLRGPKKANVRDAAVARAKSAPTPRPWAALEADLDGNYEIGVLEDDDWICDHVAFATDDPGRGVAKANAELIVRAVNAHDELVAALRLFHPNHATELYERAAEDFYRATRLMAPGKSVPLELAYDSEQEAKRQELWRPFIARWREQFIDAVLAKAGAR